MCYDIIVIDRNASLSTSTKSTMLYAPSKSQQSIWHIHWIVRRVNRKKLYLPLALTQIFFYLFSLLELHNGKDFYSPNRSSFSFLLLRFISVCSRHSFTKRIDLYFYRSACVRLCELLLCDVGLDTNIEQMLGDPIACELGQFDGFYFVPLAGNFFHFILLCE